MSVTVTFKISFRYTGIGEQAEIKINFESNALIGDVLGAFLAFVRLICACLVLSVSSTSLCLGWAAACDCGTPWTFPLPFFINCT